jgi:hypothetical protein
MQVWMRCSHQASVNQQPAAHQDGWMENAFLLGLIGSLFVNHDG